jgi:preprotein translocase subunit SecY
MTIEPVARRPSGVLPLRSQSDELTRRILFTLGALAVYRLGSYIPVPGTSAQAFGQLLTGRPGLPSWLGPNVAVSRLSILALGVTPYVMACVFLYLASGVSEQLRSLRLSRSAADRRQFNQYIRLGALLLAAAQASGMAVALEEVRGVVQDPGLVFRMSTVVSMVAGTMLLIWLGEQISVRGICDGIWLLYAADFIAELPANAASLVQLTGRAVLAGWVLPGCAALLVALTALIVLFERAERRIAIRNPGNGRGADTPPASFLRLRLDSSGILAPLLASSLLAIPVALASLVPWLPGMVDTLGRGQPLYLVLYAALIVFLALFFAAAAFDPRQWARELREAGGSVEGLPLGAQVHAYVGGVQTRVALLGALYLALVCLAPELLIVFASVPFYLGGPSLLVAVLVAMDAIQRVRPPVPQQSPP